MAWYYGTHSCGHEGRVNIIGPHKDRQWKVERHFSRNCESCCQEYLEKRHEEENLKALEAAKEMELPDLTGTDKQITWANTLRQKLMEAFEQITEEEITSISKSRLERDKDLKGITLDDMRVVKNYILENKTNATYYINNRFHTVYGFAAMEKVEALKTEEQIMKEKREKQLVEEIKAESTIFPEKRITNAVAEITVYKDKITVKFEKNELFREIVKKLGYSWDGIWERKIREVNGTVADRAAELGNKLLNKGFPICILDTDIRNNAINGVYESECKRWIYRRKDTTKFAINWTDYSDMYDQARSLPGAKWDRPSMLVDVAHFEVIEEFAELYGFKFTQSARQMIDEHKESIQKVTPVSPVNISNQKPKDGLREILNSEVGVLDDLKD